MSKEASLILLVGTSPLTPYVVACYFMEALEHNSKNVWLLYSASGPQQFSTLQQAEQIQQALRERYPSVEQVSVRLHPIRDISSAPSIQQDIKALALHLGRGPLFFNYSGGTKAMALHTYRTLEAHSQSTGQEIHFSYLDGRRFQIVDDSSGHPLHSSSLRSLVQVSIHELVNLHQFSLYRPYLPAVEPLCQAPLRVMQQILVDNQLAVFWGEQEQVGWGQVRDAMMKTCSGIHDVEKPKYLKLLRKNLQKSLPALQMALQDYQPGPCLQQVLTAFGEVGALLLRADQLASAPDAELIAFYQLIRFLDGQWLEMHVFEVLQAVFAELELKAELCMGLELRKPDWQTYFEVDIAALIGYQLLGVSCTTYNQKSACKNKGFEIIHRIRQIGGDEVREVLKMMLVTCVSALNQERLQQELAVATGSGRGSILVCGLEDLPVPRLQAKIRAFFASPAQAS